MNEWHKIWSPSSEEAGNWLQFREISCSLGAMGWAQRKALTQERRRGVTDGAEVSVQVALAVKNLPASEGDAKRLRSIPGSGRSSGGGNDNPLQYSCPENSTDRGALRATVHGVTKSGTRWSNWTHTQTRTHTKMPRYTDTKAYIFILPCT